LDINTKIGNANIAPIHAAIPFTWGGDINKIIIDRISAIIVDIIRCRILSLSENLLKMNGSIKLIS
jgi:hypothetical protein